MSPPAVRVDCADCGAVVAQKPGVSPGLLLAAAHVRADVVGQPCSAERLRKAAPFTLPAAKIWECRELWEELMADEAATFYGGEGDETYQIAAIADPPSWTDLDNQRRGLAW